MHVGMPAAAALCEPSSHKALSCTPALAALLHFIAFKPAYSFLAAFAQLLHIS
jgi:hypothetical protein